MASILVNGLCADEMNFLVVKVWRYTEDDKVWRRIGTDFGNVISVNDTTGGKRARSISTR